MIEKGMIYVGKEKIDHNMIISDLSKVKIYTKYGHVTPISEVIIKSIKTSNI